MLSMPARSRSRPRRRPDGPPPTITTCLRTGRLPITRITCPPEDNWEPVLPQAITRSHVMPRKGGRGPAGPLDIAGVVTHKPQGEGAPPDSALIAAGTVKDPEIKGHSVTGLHRPFKNAHAFGVRIGNRHIGVLIRVEGIFIQPPRRQDGLWPEMRSRHTAQACRVNRVDRTPEAECLRSFDEVIGAVLMPGRRLRCAGLLHQNMVMEQLCAVRPHQIGRHLGRRRAPDHIGKRRNAVPVAVIVKEPARLARLQIFCCIGAGIGHIHLDAGGNLLDEISEQAAHQNRAVAGVIINMLLGDKRMHDKCPFPGRERVSS